MKVVYVKTPYQGLETEKPQLIDGEVKTWNVTTCKVRGGETLNDWLTRYSNRGDVEYLLIYNVESTTRFFCDQGCKAGEGCKKTYSDDDHALIVHCYIIKK